MHMNYVDVLYLRTDKKEIIYVPFLLENGVIVRYSNNNFKIEDDIILVNTAKALLEGDNPTSIKLNIDAFKILKYNSKAITNLIGKINKINENKIYVNDVFDTIKNEV